MAGTTASPSSSSAPWLRYILIAAILIVVVAVLLVVFWPKIQFRLWIGELHSDSSVVTKGAHEKLTKSDNPDVNDWLHEVLVDPGQSFSVRTEVGEVLVKRNRIGLVEKAVRHPDPAARTAALTVLHGQTRHHGPEWFRRSYADSGQFPIVETLEAWLGRDGDTSRGSAIDLAKTLGYEQLVPAIRPLARLPEGGRLTGSEQRVLVAAARALVRFADCESVPGFVAPAREAASDIVRLRMMQVLYEAVLERQAKCPEAVDPETVKEVVLAALEDGQSNARHGALLLLQKQPEWVADAEERAYEILERKTDDTVFVRRAALVALGAHGGSRFAAVLPKYFYAEDGALRSAALEASRVYAAREDAPLRYESCWIGVLRDETKSDSAFRAAATALRETAGEWVGLPEGLDAGGREGRAKVDAFRQEIFERGESQGVDRLTWADAWFRWWAARLGLSEQAVKDAVEVRKTFWEAVERDDLEAAKQALDAFASPVPDLFLYERGRLP